MKILSITAQKPHSTGSGTYLTELVRSFARGGHSQAVVCGIYTSDSIDFPEGTGCYPVFFTDTSAKAPSLLACGCKAPAPAIGTLPFPITGMSDIMPYTSTRYRDLTDRMIRQFEEAFMSAVSRAVADLDPDLIICHHLFLLTSMVRKHFPDRRIVGISHGTDLRQMRNCPELAEMVRPHIADLDLLLALHFEQKKQIEEIFGVDGSKVKVIGSGYNDSLFNNDGRIPRGDASPVRICYAGKISRPKGVPELLRALELLSADPEVPPFEVTLAGGCQDPEVLESLDKLPDNTRWLGQIPQAELADLFRRNDIFVLPSYFEGLPLVLIEAMASGMTPVSTDLPGVRDWLDENVPDHCVRFMRMPEMAGIDEPTDAGREDFVRILAAELKKAVTDGAEGRLDGTVPDTGKITWNGVARRVIGFMEELE